MDILTYFYAGFMGVIAGLGVFFSSRSPKRPRTYKFATVVSLLWLVPQVVVFAFSQSFSLDPFFIFLIAGSVLPLLVILEESLTEAAGRTIGAAVDSARNKNKSPKN